MFHEVIVAYDVTDNKIRTKILDTLKDFGLVSLQKSVMWGEVNYAEERAIQSYLQGTLRTGDKSFLLRVGNAAEQIRNCGVGYGDAVFATVGEHLVI